MRGLVIYILCTGIIASLIIVQIAGSGSRTDLANPANATTVP